MIVGYASQDIYLPVTSEWLVELSGYCIDTAYRIITTPSPPSVLFPCEHINSSLFATRSLRWVGVTHYVYL